MGEYAEYGFDQQKVDMVCFSPVSYSIKSPYPTGDKHTISTFVDQTHLFDSYKKTILDFSFFSA